MTSRLSLASLIISTGLFLASLISSDYSDQKIYSIFLLICSALGYVITPQQDENKNKN